MRATDAAHPQVVCHGRLSAQGPRTIKSPSSMRAQEAACPGSRALGAIHPGMPHAPGMSDGSSSDRERYLTVQGENSTYPTMTVEGMKKKLSEMRKSGPREKRGNDGSESSQNQSKKSKFSGLSLPPLTPSSFLSRSFSLGSSSTSTPLVSGSGSFILPTQLPSINIPVVHTLEGSSSTISMSVPPELSYFVKCSTKILSLATINEMETIPSDVQASLLTTLRVKMGYMALRQQATMAQLHSEIIDLRRGMMDQRVTISELEEKGRRTDAENRLKSDKIKQKLLDLDLSQVYEADVGDTSTGGIGGTEDAGAKDTIVE
ncbi:hypothetical protein FNV43_RR21646 [Rhamnella rubrinervis]|uniref:Uncharacterized protein n=1 Tax=Rhamnella rubrinervis TaxID=2594499 RepID=A0A8K0GRC0_9ROSA|nr:hypothetical protein FNV43_RR21646 [Rhamnella rubrinervis]